MCTNITLNLFSNSARRYAPQRAAVGFPQALLLLIAVLGAAPAPAKPPASTPLAVTPLADLRFGTVALAGSGAGWVAVPPAGAAVTVGGDLVALGGDRGSALFEVKGMPHCVFQIALPQRLKLANQVTITQLLSDPEWSGVLDGDGRATVRVGGRLEVGKQANNGRQSATLQMEVRYP